MSRSLYKGFYWNSNFKKSEENTIIKIFNKNLRILPEYNGRIFDIYNGAKFIRRKINENMFNFKFGDFIYTRERNFYKKSRKKKISKNK